LLDAFVDLAVHTANVRQWDDDVAVFASTCRSRMTQKHVPSSATDGQLQCSAIRL